jgi:ABC-2 type transport system ATP-binding protein
MLQLSGANARGCAARAAAGLYNRPVIEFRAVGLRLGGRELLSDFHWQLPDAGTYLLLGGTGSGKSLLSRLLAGRLRPQRGAVVVDGEPLYRLVGGYSAPIFYAAAEQAGLTDELLGDYLAAELHAAGGRPALLAGVLPVLEDYLPAAPRQQLSALSHGQLLLAQLALAVALPVRLAVLDGHLTYLDQRACEVAALLLEQAAQQDKFLLLSAARLAHYMPQMQHSFVLSGEFPLTLTELVSGETVDTGLAIVREAEGLVTVHCAPRPQGYGAVTSGRHFTVAAHLEDGLKLRLVGALSDALAELAQQGVVAEQIEWRRQA